MRCAADFRAEARAALKGRWGLAIGIGFLAMVLGGIAGVGGLDVNFVMVEGNFQMTLDIFGQRLNPVEMMRNIGVGSAFLVWQYLSVAAALVAIVRLIVGSFVGVGYMKFNLDLIDGEEGRLETLFRYVKQWGTMLAAVLLQAVYIIGWMKGNKWRLLCLDFSFIGWDILSAFTLGIGDLWLTPYRSAAAAAFYRELVPLEKGEEPEEMQETQTEEDVISEE